VVIFIV